MLRKLLIITLLLGCTATGYAQKKHKKRKDKEAQAPVTEEVSKEINYKEDGAPMPDIKIITKDGTKLVTEDFDGHSYLWVMMFNPTCDHCQEQTFTIEKNIDLFDKTKIVMLASPEMESFLDFYNNVTRYSKYPKINVGIDSSDFINKTFRYEALPQINIYDKDKKLIKVFAGAVAIDALKPYID